MEDSKTKGLIIMGFKSENFKRLNAVSFTPDGNNVIISGDNEQGKSSILDGIRVTLGGKKVLEETPNPIHTGKDSANVEVVLGKDGKPMFCVKRTFTKTDSYLKITSPEGANYGAPQSLLEKLYDARTIDPSEFSRMDEEKQFKLLKSLVKTDYDEIEEMRKGVFDERTEVNRDVKSLKSRFAALPVPEEGIAEEEIPSQSVMDEIQAASDIITENNEKRTELQAKGNEYKTLSSKKVELETKIAELQEELKTVTANLETVRAEGKKLKEEVAALEDPDLTELNQQLQNLEQTNKKIRDAKEFRTLQAQVTEKEQEAAELTREIDDYEQKKEQALKDAEFPVEGLGFSETGVMFKGVPFTQASQEEKLTVGFHIARSLKPDIQVILLREAAFLDKKNFAKMKELAIKYGYQIWYEMIDAKEETGIIIEDGSIKGIVKPIEDKASDKPSIPPVEEKPKAKKGKKDNTQSIDFGE